MMQYRRQPLISSYKPNVGSFQPVQSTPKTTTPVTTQPIAKKKRKVINAFSLNRRQFGNLLAKAMSGQAVPIA